MWTLKCKSTRDYVRVRDVCDEDGYNVRSKEERLGVSGDCEMSSSARSAVV